MCILCYSDQEQILFKTFSYIKSLFIPKKGTFKYIHFFFHIRTVQHLDIIKVLFIYQLMH